MRLRTDRLKLIAAGHALAPDEAMVMASWLLDVGTPEIVLGVHLEQAKARLEMAVEALRRAERHIQSAPWHKGDDQTLLEIGAALMNAGALPSVCNDLESQENETCLTTERLSKRPPSDSSSSPRTSRVDSTQTSPSSPSLSPTRSQQRDASSIGSSEPSQKESADPGLRPSEAIPPRGAYLPDEGRFIFGETFLRCLVTFEGPKEPCGLTKNHRGPCIRRSLLDWAARLPDAEDLRTNAAPHWDDLPRGSEERRQAYNKAVRESGGALGPPAPPVPRPRPEEARPRTNEETRHSDEALRRAGEAPPWANLPKGHPSRDIQETLAEMPFTFQERHQRCTFKPLGYQVEKHAKDCRHPNESVDRTAYNSSARTNEATTQVDRIAEALGLVDYPEGQGPQYGSVAQILASIRNRDANIRDLQAQLTKLGSGQATASHPDTAHLDGTIDVFNQGWAAAIKAAVGLCEQEARICKRQKESVPSKDRAIHLGGQCIATTLASRIGDLEPES